MRKGQGRQTHAQYISRSEMRAPLRARTSWAGKGGRLLYCMWSTARTRVELAISNNYHSKTIRFCWGGGTGVTGVHTHSPLVRRRLFQPGQTPFVQSHAGWPPPHQHCNHTWLFLEPVAACGRIGSCHQSPLGFLVEMVELEAGSRTEAAARAVS